MSCVKSEVIESPSGRCFRVTSKSIPKWIDSVIPNDSPCTQIYLKILPNQAWSTNETNCCDRVWENSKTCQEWCFIYENDYFGFHLVWSTGSQLIDELKKINSNDDQNSPDLLKMWMCDSFWPWQKPRWNRTVIRRTDRSPTPRSSATGVRIWTPRAAGSPSRCSSTTVTTATSVTACPWTDPSPTTDLKGETC